jgi:hypothetical protein
MLEGDIGISKRRDRVEGKKMREERRKGVRKQSLGKRKTEFRYRRYGRGGTSE